MDDAGRKWEARRVTFPDDRELLYRARAAFFRPGEEAYVDWLCGENPAGTPYCYMAMDGDIIAGQYMTVPVSLSVQGKPVIACLSLDTFTNENYRKQGIFVTLAERVYAEAEGDGCRFTIGLPNANSRPGFLKNLGFTEPFSLYQSVLPLPLKSLTSSESARRAAAAWQKIGRPFERNYKFRTDMKTIDIEWGDSLWRRLQTRRSWGLVKDGQWLKWRFGSRPNFEYNMIVAEEPAGLPAGYLAWSRDRSPDNNKPTAWVLDVEGVTLGVRLALVRHLAREVAADVDRIKSLNTPFSRYGLALTLSGFAPVRKQPFIFRPHGVGLRDLPALTSQRTDLSTAIADFL